MRPRPLASDTLLIRGVCQIWEQKLAGELLTVRHCFDKVQEDAVLYLMAEEREAEQRRMTEG